MGYRGDFIHYGKGTECPEVYLQWAGLSLLGAVLGRKVWTMHGDYFKIHPNLYVCLVGDAGSGKSTAKNQAKQFLRLADPDYLIASSFQSHQDIIDKMANDPTATKIWKDNTKPGQLSEYRVFYGICNELASLLSTDKKGMVEFLVDVFDEDEFATGYKNSAADKKQIVPSPYVSILACAVPKWFMGNLKLDLFDGGLGRRLIVVYSDKTKLNANPTLPPGGAEAKQRVLEHLRICASEKIQGNLSKSPDAQLWWDTWYHRKDRFDLTDPIISQFDQTKHIEILKVATILAKSRDPYTKIIETEDLAIAEKMLTDLEPNVRRLTSGIGRNELAGIGSQVIEFINRTGGMQTEVNVKKAFWRHAQTREFNDILTQYQATGEILVKSIPQPNGQIRTVYVTPGNGETTYNQMLLSVVKPS